LSRKICPHMMFYVRMNITSYAFYMCGWWIRPQISLMETEFAMSEQKKLPHDHGGEAEEILQYMPDPPVFGDVAEAMKQLGDSSRLRIFWILCHCEECVINIAALMEMSSPAVSHHLRLLKNSGIIISHRRGKEMYYRAADTQLARALHRAIEEVARISCPDRFHAHPEPIHHYDDHDHE